MLEGGGRGGAAPGARLGNCLAVLIALFALVFDAEAPILIALLQLRLNTGTGENKYNCSYTYGEVVAWYVRS